jgi:hypothetical protein
LLNFLSITLPLLQSYIWELRRKKISLDKTVFINNDNEKFELMKQLVEGKDPNSDFRYLLCILEDVDGLKYLKEFSQSEFSVENVFF